MKINYGYGVVVLPQTALAMAEEASKTDVCVLMHLCVDPALIERQKLLAQLVGESEKAVKKSVAFWCEKGVITVDADTSEGTPYEVPLTEDKPTKKLLPARDEAPVYNTEAITAVLEKHNKLNNLLDEVQNLLGKMLNMAETGKILCLADYYGLSNAYILTLCAYCVERGHNETSYIERCALNFMNKGIQTSSKLDKAIREEKKLHELETKIRAMFGVGTRELTSAESKCISTWLDFGYDLEVIRTAYEITVTNTGKPTFKYANAILENWHAEGLKTKAEVDDFINKQKTDKMAATGRSFDPDDFFNAALKKSLERGKEG